MIFLQTVKKFEKTGKETRAIITVCRNANRTINANSAISITMYMASNKIFFEPKSIHEFKYSKP